MPAMSAVMRVPSKTGMWLPGLSRVVDDVPGGFQRETKQERLWGLAFSYEFWHQLLQNRQLGFWWVEGLHLEDNGEPWESFEQVGDRIRLGFC